MPCPNVHHAPWYTMCPGLSFFPNLSCPSLAVQTVRQPCFDASPKAQPALSKMHLSPRTQEGAMAPQRAGRGRPAGWPLPSSSGSSAPERSFQATQPQRHAWKPSESWRSGRDRQNLGWKYEVQTTRCFSPLCDFLVRCLTSLTFICN